MFIKDYSPLLSVVVSSGRIPLLLARLRTMGTPAVLTMCDKGEEDFRIQYLDGEGELDNLATEGIAMNTMAQALRAFRDLTEEDDRHA